MVRCQVPGRSKYQLSLEEYTLNTALKEFPDKVTRNRNWHSRVNENKVKHAAMIDSWQKQPVRSELQG